MKHPIRAALIAASAALGLSACMGDDYGYGGMSLGYGSGYYGGYPYYGWYDDFYYPGTGYYVYDRIGRRHSWSDSQRRYWEGRRGDRRYRENWSGYRSRDPATTEAWRQRREAWRAQRQQEGATATPPRQHRDRNWWRDRRGD